MKKYDVTVLVEANVSAENRKKIETRLEKLITGLDGKVVKSSELGKKQLAYKIKKMSEALFLNWIVELPPKAVVQLEKKLTVDPEVIRHLLVVSE